MSVRASRLAVTLTALAVLVGLCAAPAAAGTRPAVATNPRHVKVVAGLHDTAINDCDKEGTLPLPDASASLDDTHRRLAGRSMRNAALQKLPGVTSIRVTIPWDVADAQVVDGSNVYHKRRDKHRVFGTRACLDAWLKAVFSHGKQPEIDLRGDKNFAKRNGQVLMPTLAQYRTAVLAFRKRYVDCRSLCSTGGRVTVVGPWNEPDNAGGNKVGSNYDLAFPNGRTRLGGNYCPAHPDITNCGATMAGQLWVTVHDLIVEGTSGGTPCGTCLVPAAVFSGGDGFRVIHGGACPNTCRYMYLYNQRVRSKGQRPRQWALHPYSDTKAYQSGSTFRPTKLALFARNLKNYGYGRDTFIWINEISVCLTGSQLGTCAKHYDTSRGKPVAMDWLLTPEPGHLTMTVAPDGPQVGRIVYFCFVGGEKRCNNGWSIVHSGSQRLNAAGRVFAKWANG